MSLTIKPKGSRRRSNVENSKSKSVDNEDTYNILDLPSLRRKRTLALNRMKKALSVGRSALNDASQINLFISHYQGAKQIASTFDHVHSIILDLLDKEPDEEDSEQTRFDDLYHEVKSIYLSFSDGQPKPTEPTSWLKNCNHSNVQLPQITLPTFSGEIKAWPTYFSTYTGLVHNHSGLNDIEKFHYLVSSLSGDALSTISMYPLQAEYYNCAYQALIERYNKQRDLAYACWKSILNAELKFSNVTEVARSLNLIQENLKILKSMELPIEQWDFPLVYLLFSKLDKDLRRNFDSKYPKVEFPSFQLLFDFLQSKCTAATRDAHFCEKDKSKQNIVVKNSFAQSSSAQSKRASHVLVAADAPAAPPPPINSAEVPTKHNVNGTNTMKCSYCEGTHSISSCTAFLQKSIDERMKVASDKKWCFNCLKPSHQLKACKSVFSCRKCNRKHHTTLHRDQSPSQNIPNALSAATDGAGSAASVLVTRAQSNSTVLLATALVQVRDAFGKMQFFRALFDTGSQNNFITLSAVQRLHLKPSNTEVQVCGLGEARASIVGEVSCEIGTNNRTLLHLPMHVISSICGEQPIAKLNTSGCSYIDTLTLADPGYDIPGPIDILFGADVFADSLLNETKKGRPDQPIAFNSIFGWLLLGKTRLLSNTLLNASSLETDNKLNSLVKKFWELDSIPTASSLTPDEILCEQKYVNEHTRDSSGRYVLRLPFKGIEPTFTGSRDIALRRFYAIEKRLSRDPELRSQYSEFMTDYRTTGHMSLVRPADLSSGRYYLSHHCVLRPDAASTRLRVVFDASAKDYRSQSLNDSQLTGPKLQPNIAQILLRFREHRVVFMADVRQMYRQMLVAPEHRDYQRILWRDSPAEPLREYRLNTVTYGVSSSPFLACRTVRQLAEDEGDSFPIAKQIMLTDIYIDDVISGLNSYEEAQRAKTQLIDVFKRGGFLLRKWVSNVPQLLSDLRPEDCLSGSVNLQLDKVENPIHKVLGLKWDQSSDAFFFEIEASSRPCTKRAILSELARIYDPLGFLSPITIQAKCLIQKLWILGVTWDQTPPDEVTSTWNLYRSQLTQLSQIRIPRLLTWVTAKSYDLHGFCDSSEKAFGAVIYLRVTLETGEINTHFVCSKARVVPLKRISLPRLELCAAVLLSDLYEFVRETYLARIPIDAVYLWSDSTVVLSWLRSHSSRWVTFVANRVSHIQEITPTGCWHHVPSGCNPADICSRGQFPSEISHNSLWWAGPSWLCQDRSAWPTDNQLSSDHDEALIDTESRKNVTLVSDQIDSESESTFPVLDALITRFSSLSKLINIVTYMMRFIHNVRYPMQRNLKQFLDNVERHNALMQLIKHVQSNSFPEVIHRLKQNQTLPKPFSKLNPFFDSRGILRVGGRISRSGLEFEHKHPALLPSNHTLTMLIIDNIHRSYCHPGINTTHFLLLQQFWIVSAKRVIRSCLSKCISCYRLNPQPLQPFMSDLPAYRVNQIKAFSIVGTDFGGPFRIKLGPHRGAKLDKAYLCLFICLATKAVHLEVVSSLSTDAFIAALRRFVGRRGRCNEIHADCGTNFVGARNQLSLFMQHASEAEKIDFKFNPASSPHWGGVWESQIKAAKALLYRVVGEQVLTFEELTTLFVQIEATLNSRPLCPISADPNDFSVLTPGHFLTLEPLTSVPDEDLSKVNVSRLHRWQLLQAFHQHFWSRWKSEYLNTLTQRAKWTKHSKPLSIGSMVIIKDDIRAPLHWPIGRVIELIPGTDGVVRMAIVKTSQNNRIHRPLVKLCPLPMEN